MTTTKNPSPTTITDVDYPEQDFLEDINSSFRMNMSMLKVHLDDAYESFVNGNIYESAHLFERVQNLANHISDSLMRWDKFQIRQYRNPNKVASPDTGKEDE